MESCTPRGRRTPRGRVAPLRPGAGLAIDPEYAAVATLDGFKTDDLAKTGDSQKQIMTHEAAFECANEKAHFVIADLQ